MFVQKRHEEILWLEKLKFLINFCLLKYNIV